MINKLVIANLVQRPARTILIILVIALEVATILTLIGVSYGALEAAAMRAKGVGADVLVQPPGSSIIGLNPASMSDELLPVLMREPHVLVVFGTIVQPLSGMESIVGIDHEQFAKMNGDFQFLEGGIFKADQDAIVDVSYAREHKVHVGDTINLTSYDWRISGVFESGKLARICVKLSVLQKLTANSHHLSQIYLKLDDSKNSNDVVVVLRTRLPKYAIYTMEEFISLLTITGTGILRDFRVIVTGIFAMAGFIVVFMAMYIAVLGRTQEIGILKALGSASSMILGIVLREALLLSISGTLLGIPLTYLGQELIRRAVPASVAQQSVYSRWPMTATITITGAILGAIIPAIKAVNQDALETLSYE